MRITWETLKKWHKAAGFGRGSLYTMWGGTQLGKSFTVPKTSGRNPTGSFYVDYECSMKTPTTTKEMRYIYGKVRR